MNLLVILEFTQILVVKGVKKLKLLQQQLKLVEQEGMIIICTIIISYLLKQRRVMDLSVLVLVLLVVLFIPPTSPHLAPRWCVS